jgi:hypothetical protein
VPVLSVNLEHVVMPHGDISLAQGIALHDGARGGVPPRMTDSRVEESGAP